MLQKPPGHRLWIAVGSQVSQVSAPSLSLSLSPLPMHSEAREAQSGCTHTPTLRPLLLYSFTALKAVSSQSRASECVLSDRRNLHLSWGV